MGKRFSDSLGGKRCLVKFFVVKSDTLNGKKREREAERLRGRIRRESGKDRDLPKNDHCEIKNMQCSVDTKVFSILTLIYSHIGEVIYYIRYYQIGTALGTISEVLCLVL